MKKVIRELTVSEVAEIKWHLLKQDLKQKEIALKFGVTPSVISKINSGQRYKEIQIDENGDLIEQQKEEILPEHFNVPSFEEEEEREKAINDESTPFRVEFVSKYFKRKEPRKDSYDEKATYIHYEPVSKKSRRFIFSLYRQYSGLFNREWSDFISQVMFVVTRITMTFEPREKDFDWTKVMTDGTKESSTLHDYINKAIRTEIQTYANEINETIKVERDGVIGWSTPSMTSLNQRANDEDDSAYIGDYVTTSYWHMEEGYLGSQFLDWYSENYKNLLTKGQIKYLNTMKYFERDRNDKYTVPYSKIPDVYKPYSQQAVEHNRRRIRERVEGAYEKVHPSTLRKMGFQKEYQFWTSFMDFVWIDDDRIDEQSRLLTAWLKQRVDSPYMTDMFWHLKPEHVLAFNRDRSEIAVNTLYIIVEYAEDRMKYLEKLIEREKKVAPFVRKFAERGQVHDEPEQTAAQSKPHRFVSTPSGIFHVKGD